MLMFAALIPFSTAMLWCGYPRGLKKEQIPIISRIVSVIDAYDAMTNNRPYRNAMSTEEAIEELNRCSGIQFDPQLVDEFINILIKEKSNQLIKV